MANLNWLEILGWNSYQLEELRFAGFSFVRQGKYDKALNYFKSLVILDPKSAYDFQMLGALYLQTNEEAKALPMLNQALELDPTHEPTQLNKVKTLITLGQKSEAFALAAALEKSKNRVIADDATAVIMAHS